jgi:cytochrome P450
LLVTAEISRTDRAQEKDTMTDTCVRLDEPELDDLLCDLAINHPVEYYGRLRAVDPVYWNERWNGWILTGYREVAAGYRDHSRLSSDRFAGPFGAELQAGASAYENLIGFLSNFFVWKDQPYHTRIRGLVNKAFTPRSVEVIRQQVRELVDDLVQRLVGAKDVDFFARFAFPLPVIVIAEYLGVPPEGRDRMRQWAEDLGAVIFVSGRDEDRMAKGEAAMVELVDFLRPIVRSKRSNPQPDLLTGMVQAVERGDFLSEDEVIANAVLMVFAGHETTMNLLANSMVAFSRFPDQWQLLREKPSMAITAVEELLRYDGPIRAMARWAKEPLTIGRHQISEGDRLLLVQYGANHDPAAFADPDRLDISRWPNKHLTFGHGIHTCLGAPLARLEAQEALTALAAQFGGLEIAETSLAYTPTMVSRSLQQLHVNFHP